MQVASIKEFAKWAKCSHCNEKHGQIDDLGTKENSMCTLFF